MLLRYISILGGCLFWLCSLHAEDSLEKQQRHYWDEVRPIMRKHCRTCHNAVDKKGGVNLVQYDFIVQIVKNGKLFSHVIEVIEDGTMPPNTKPPLTASEKDTLTTYLRKYLRDALSEPDPGIIPPRRLSNREYKYTLYDLLGVEIDTESRFPSDASGGSGFDNQARTLYLSPLQIERYYEVAEEVIENLSADSPKWNQLFPPYKESWGVRMKFWWKGLWNSSTPEIKRYLHEHALKSLQPFATRAYRRLLRASEQQTLLDLFDKVYETQTGSRKARYETSLKEVLKAVLISPHFLYRQEADQPVEGNYLLGDFELASRLSYLMWSSMPDPILMNLAYEGKLQNPEILEEQVKRMLADRKSYRMAESFASQWLEVNKLLRPDFQLDPEKFPEYTPELRDDMYQQTVRYFHHTLTQSQNVKELLDSDYTVLNQTLADVYGIPGNYGDELEVACLTDRIRGGVLGMGAVLTATSLPERTSPVLRGKWVLEQLLDSPPPPPPPDVPELEAVQEIHEELSLRKLLERHRSDEACSGCHRDMDALGLSLENFDAMGRWRDTYQRMTPIDARGELKTGETFDGPGELKQVLMTREEDFAEAFSRKMLSYALGRPLSFTDTPTIEHLTQTLIDTDFHSITFLSELVKSFPFRYKKTDFAG